MSISKDADAELSVCASRPNENRPVADGNRVREYVGAMSTELARMARGHGDEKLACVLDIAADIAMQRSLGAIG